MATKLLKWSWLAAAAALLLAATSQAQITRFNEQEWLNSPAATSHIGNISGNAKNAAGDYRRYCVGCHGPTWVTGTARLPNGWIPNPATSLGQSSSAAPRLRGRCQRTRIFYDTIARGLDRSNMPRWNTFTKQAAGRPGGMDQAFLSPLAEGESRARRFEIPAEPEVTPERVKAGQEVFGRVQCWKCHGVEGMANGPSASTLTDDLNRPILPTTSPRARGPSVVPPTRISTGSS